LFEHGEGFFEGSTEVVPLVEGGGVSSAWSRWRMTNPSRSARRRVSVSTLCEISFQRFVKFLVAATPVLQLS